MLLLLLALVVSAAAVKCPAGSTYSSNYNACYLVSNSDASWRASESICNILGGHLASIGSQQQNDFILKVLDNTYGVYGFWLGVNSVRGGPWQNVDGTPFNYSNFNGSSPPPASFKHTVVYMMTEHPNKKNDGLWEVVDESRGGVNYFVCQLPPCNSDGFAPASLLTPNQPNTGLYFGNLTNAWYYGTREINDEYNCQTIGGHLPSIHNAYQNSQFMDIAFAFGFKRTEPVHLGYHSDWNGVWGWSDGSNSTYTNWGTQEPYTNNHDTMYSMYDGTWYTSTFEGDDPIICEWNEDDRKKYC